MKIMYKIENFGILTSVSWNSNNWKDDLTEEDVENSQYAYVKEEGHAHESLNFGHGIYPLENDEKYIAYSPIFNNKPKEANAKNLTVVFFISTDYRSSAKKIIGCYGFPEIGDFDRQSEHEKFKAYDYGNVRSHVDDIVYLKKHVSIDNQIVKDLQLLPGGKKISNRGFNYLDSDNVYKVFKMLLAENKNNKALKRLSQKTRKIQTSNNSSVGELQDVGSVINTATADTLADIHQLEERMKNQKPSVKERVSKFIERGAIASKIKKVTKYKCLICDALGDNPHSFKKSNGEYYVETHHVEPVSNRKLGSLSVSNLITVCPNHHRQLHYGACEVLGNTKKFFKFEIDGKKLKVEKIKI